MRVFESGANRDDDEGKIDFEGIFHPSVIQAYGRYMESKSHLPDGSTRTSDNWQKGFGDDHCKVCIKSAFRHFMDWWAWHRGDKRINIEDTLCALMFNLQAYLFKLLTDTDTYAVITDSEGEPVKTTTHIPELGTVEGTSNE
jgi:hypothetical protein